MKLTLQLFTALLLAPLAVLHAADPKPTAPSRDDARWLREKGTLLFHDAFEREETGNGMKAIGNGWESATADRVPQIKQADLDGGILKLASATKEAGHAAHVHHDAGFADGGAVVRFKFPGLNKMNRSRSASWTARPRASMRAISATASFRRATSRSWIRRPA